MELKIRGGKTLDTDTAELVGCWAGLGEDGTWVCETLYQLPDSTLVLDMLWSLKSRRVEVVHSADSCREYWEHRNRINSQSSQHDLTWNDRSTEKSDTKKAG